jgi:hypothetical protein
MPLLSGLILRNVGLSDLNIGLKYDFMPFLCDRQFCLLALPCMFTDFQKTQVSGLEPGTLNQLEALNM